MIVLGIDPGTRRAGFGIIKKDKGEIHFLSAGLLAIRGGSDGEALQDIRKDLNQLILEWRPDVLAVEKLFFVKNQKTGMRVAEARGVIIASGMEHGLTIREYSPNEIKSGITGYGMADKRAVAKMVKYILKKPDLKVIDDASDALAVAIFACNDNR